MLKFLGNWLEKNMAKTNEGFAAYRRGKELYFAFVNAHGTNDGVGAGDPALEEAYELYLKAERFAQDEGRYQGVAAVNAELGKICELRGDYRQSIAHRRKAIETFEALPKVSDADSETIRDSYLYLAKSLSRCGETEEAKKTASAGMEKYRAANDPYGIGELQKILDADE